MTYRHIAEVKISLRFPIDMLRYDRCCPLHESDATAIEKSLQDTDYDGAVIQVVKFSCSNVFEHAFCLMRWKSFGCELKLVGTEKIRGMIQ